MKQSDFYRKQKANDPSENSRLDQLFDNLRNENNDGTFPVVEKWLRNINSLKSNNITPKKERKLFNMRSPKIRFAYAFLLLAVIVAACNYPVTQQETVADVIKWSVNKNNTEAIQKIQGLDWTKKAITGISKPEAANDKIEYKLVLLKDELGNAQKYMDQLKGISGINDISLVPLNEKITRPVYSVALNKIFKVDINATNMSDQDLKNEIETQLSQNGIRDVQISFDRNKDGKRISKIELPEGSLKDNSGFDITIKDGNNIQRTAEVRKFRNEGEGDRFKDKTDDEIRKMVAEDIGDKNIRPEDIMISRKDGKIMINVKKQGIENEDKIESKIEIK
ncbi:MAG TPA: hypothetical protein PK536_09890 [Ignavibacteria bacterium]|nr:hypothetical protein [Ignavibacteria bacterium]HRJ99719.1 hypothetical protein [Ignavibacteria bacterium]